ncbi:MAG: acyloxyacyl hydrolase [Terracidiphilus sp.]
MPENDKLRLPTLPLCLFFASAMAIAAGGTVCAAQGRDPGSYYARANTLGIVGAYSWDSSHMLLGAATNRELLNIGISYSRRLLMNRVVNWQYDGELLPIALESDPTATQFVQYSGPNGGSASYNLGAQLITCTPLTMTFSASEGPGGTPVSYTATDYCSGREWTVGQSISPIGMQWNFLPGRRIQSLLEGHGGYMYSTRPIPIVSAGSFNFTFDIGAGFEIFHSNLNSIRIEYRYHHISNHYTATTNPGIDSGLAQLTYCFRLGRK